MEDPDAVVAKADDVGFSIAGGVCEQARMFVHAPASGAVAKAGHDELWSAEGAIAVGARHVNAVVAETDDGTRWLVWSKRARK